MDSLNVARSMRGAIGMLATEWLLAPSTLAKAAERGMPAGRATYAVGRLGVLGDCPVDNVVGAAYFWDPDLMREMVIEGRAKISPAEGAKIYAGICQEWGEEKLGDFAGSDRLGELLTKVVSTASPLGAPTFVGWRDQELPAHGPGRTFQLAQTMRELRFARHTIAVQASGMGPLEAILSGPAGEWNAEMFGWPKPYPGVEQLTAQREAIEAHTDRLHAPDLEVLNDGERGELRQLAMEAKAHTSHLS